VFVRPSLLRSPLSYTLPLCLSLRFHHAATLPVVVAISAVVARPPPSAYGCPMPLHLAAFSIPIAAVQPDANQCTKVLLVGFDITIELDAYHEYFWLVRPLSLWFVFLNVYITLILSSNAPYDISSRLLLL
jgi:hypothetical protein